MSLNPFILAHIMFAPDFSMVDLERIGPVIESLLSSGKLSDEEHAVVDLCGRAAADLGMMRQSEVAKEFYSRSEIAQHSADSIAEWLAENPAAAPGTVTAIAGPMHVASLGRDAKLQLTPILEL